MTLEQTRSLIFPTVFMSVSLKLKRMQKWAGCCDLWPSHVLCVAFFVIECDRRPRTHTRTQCLIHIPLTQALMRWWKVTRVKVCALAQRSGRRWRIPVCGGRSEVRGRRAADRQGQAVTQHWADKCKVCFWEVSVVSYSVHCFMCLGCLQPKRLILTKDSNIKKKHPTLQKNINVKT